MKQRLTILIAFCFLSSLLVGCDKLNLLTGSKKTVAVKPAEQAPAPVTVKGTVIAKVNNAPVTLEELNKEIDTYNAMVPADRPELKINTRDQKIEFLKNEMVRRLLLYQTALAKGLEKKAEVVQAIEKTKQDLLVMELVRQEAERVDVSSKEIEDFYNSYKEQYKEPEERQLWEIVVSSESEAKEAMIRLFQGADFSTLAKEISKAASAKEGGDLGFLSSGKKFPQFDAVAFSDTLEVGKISSIFKGPDGYYILKLEGKKGGKQKSLTEMWDDLKRGLTFLKQEKKVKDLIDGLSREAKLEFYEGEIK